MNRVWSAVYVIVGCAFGVTIHLLVVATVRVVNWLRQ